MVGRTVLQNLRASLPYKCSGQPRREKSGFSLESYPKTMLFGANWHQFLHSLSLPLLRSCGKRLDVLFLKARQTGTTPYEETLHNPSMLYLGSRVLGGVFLTAVQPEMPG